MKRMLTIGLAAAAIGVFAMPTESYAQRGFGGARGLGGFGGGRSGFSSGFGNYGLNNYGLGGYGNSFYGNSLYGSGYGGGRGYGSNRGYYGNGYNNGYSNSGYVYSNPGVVYSDPVSNYSFYPPEDSAGGFQTNANYGASGTIVVYVPANAQLWWGSAATSTTGVERRFATSAISPQGEVNTFQAQWRDANGQVHNETRQVRAMPGQTVAVDFRQQAQNAQPQQAVTPQQNVVPQNVVPQPRVQPNQNANPNFVPNQNIPNPNVPNRPNQNVNPDDTPPEPIR